MRLGDRRFFDLFGRLMAASNPKLERDDWEVADVRWSRERHLYWGRDCSFRIETHTLERPAAGRAAWRLLVVTEDWWPADRRKAMRSVQWAQVVQGSSADVRRWFAEQAGCLDR